VEAFELDGAVLDHDHRAAPFGGVIDPRVAGSDLDDAQLE